MELLAISVVNVLTWFLQPFAYILVINWVISLFRKD